VEIAEWLQGLGLEQYASAFAENAVRWDTAGTDRVLDQAAIPRRLAPGKKLARVHPVALRDRADACPGLQRLGHNLLLIGKAPAPPALNRDDLRPLHRARSSPSVTSNRSKPPHPPTSKAPSPSGYATADIAISDTVLLSGMAPSTFASSRGAKRLAASSTGPGERHHLAGEVAPHCAERNLRDLESAEPIIPVRSVRSSLV
jgi:hypothetical protein